jgi:alpha-ketoglutarate-dependent taurine dioxygenase
MTTTRITEATPPGKRAPLFISCISGSPSLCDFVGANQPRLLEALTEHGAILFRGFDVGDVTQFSMFVAATGGRCIDYQLRSTPRTLVSDQIYTSTEYPADREILLHNEHAYNKIWPRRLAFCCLIAATDGGETPIADMREVTQHIGNQLMDRFEGANVKYIRHYHRGIDLSWQDVFQTSDPATLAKICAAHGILHRWIGVHGKLLQTTQICQGVAYHPITAERLFFNQAHLFHVTSMGSDIANMLRATFGADRLPRHATYGDHSEIPVSDILRIHRAFKENEILFQWKRGDVLWLDNMQVAHGRRSYKGTRRVLVALMDSSGDP